MTNMNNTPADRRRGAHITQSEPAGQAGEDAGSDLRQGVSEAAHAVLDMLEELKAGDPFQGVPGQHLLFAKSGLASAARASSEWIAAAHAREAAAHLIRFAELMADSLERLNDAPPLLDLMESRP